MGAGFGNVGGALTRSGDEVVSRGKGAIPQVRVSLVHILPLFILLILLIIVSITT
jgi:hypothetical protein